MKHSYRRKIFLDTFVKTRDGHQPGKIIALPSKQTSWKYIVESLQYPRKKLQLFRDEIRKLRPDEIKNLAYMIQSAYEIRQLCDHGNKRE